MRVFLPYQFRILKPWNDPGRSFWLSASESYLIYDHSRRKFRRRLKFWEKFFKRSYFQVYYNQKGKIIGHKLIVKSFFIPFIHHAERIYLIGDDELLQKRIEWEYYNHYFPLHGFSESNREEDYYQIMLWQMAHRFNPDRLGHDVSYLYRSGDTLLEFIVNYKIKGLQINGKNISAQESLEMNRYIKKYYNLNGFFTGYDEIYNYILRSAMKLIYNEDRVLVMTIREARTKKNAIHREITRFDSFGKKVQSELYEDSHLKKSAVFVYNEDSKLVSIKQYGPDGNPLN